MASTRQPVSFLATSNADTATSFYRDVMGLELIETSPFAVAFADGPSTLRIQIVESFEPADYTAHGWQVKDITAQIKALTEKGAVFMVFERLTQDDLGIWTSPDGHKIAWFKDTSGNILSLTQLVKA